MFTKEDIIRGFQLWYAELSKEESKPEDLTWEDFTPEQQAEYLVWCMENGE